MKAIFLDRDGTLIKDSGYLINFNEMELVPGALEGMRLLQKNGFELFIITNQSGVARGYFTLEQLKEFHSTLQRFLTQQGITIKKISFCPHHPDGKVLAFKKNCDCRKPLPGMVLELARKFPLDLSRSFIIGDRLSDAEVSLHCAVKGVLVTSGPEPPPAEGHQFPIYENLLSFAKAIHKESAHNSFKESPL